MSCLMFSKNKKNQVKVTKSKTNMMQAAATAAAFAEAGEHDTARSIVIPEARNRMLAQMAVLHRMLGAKS